MEKELIKKIERIVGYVPVGTKDLLHILKHPDIIELSKAYLQEESQNLHGL